MADSRKFYLPVVQIGAVQRLTENFLNACATFMVRKLLMNLQRKRC